MYVATVIPIARGVPFDRLTYYCPDLLNDGTIVSIPFGKQIITGVIIESTPLTDARSIIKKAAFSLKKIKAVINESIFFKNIISAWKKTSQETLVPIGSIAGATTTQSLFEYLKNNQLKNKSSNDSNNTYFKEAVIAAPEKERVDHYRRLIRNAFALKKVVFFVAPTIHELEKWKTNLEKGISKNVLIIHSGLSKKKISAVFSKIIENSSPLLIFMTASYFTLPCSDLGYVIVENESSSLYKTNDRYTIDLRIFIKNFSEFSNLNLTWGDTLPRLETLYRLNQITIPRINFPENIHILTIDSYKDTLPKDFISIIQHAKKKKYKIFIYTPRKGIAPISRCNDCGTSVDCPTCELPMVLKSRFLADKKKERYFICTHCGDQILSDYICKKCSSWNITPLAIGTESLESEVVKIVGPEHVFAIDDDITPTESAIEKKLKIIDSLNFAVIVGTIKALRYIKNTSYSIFPYIDRTLSIPSYQTNEAVLRLILTSNDLSSKGIIIFTKSIQYPFVNQLKSLKINEIIKEELSLRKEMSYPPFGTLIKISVTTPEGFQKKIKEKITSFFDKIDITPLSSRRVSPGSMKIVSIWIIRTNNDYIEDEGENIISFLDELNYPYKIEQNPERF